MEWTNFTPKPDGYKSRKVSRVQGNLGAGQNGDEESRSETQEDCSVSELDTSIPEELESNGCGGNLPQVNGINSHCETTNVH